MILYERHPALTRLLILFLTYVAILQVLYALQTIVVSIPFVALASTCYLLILQPKKSIENNIHCTGSNVKTSTAHEQDLQSLLVHQTEKVLRTNLTQFQQVKFSRRFLLFLFYRFYSFLNYKKKALSAPNSQINSDNFDQKLTQTIFDKCVSREIFQELPDVIDSVNQNKKLIIFIFVRLISFSVKSNRQIPPKPQRQSSNTSSSLTSLPKSSSNQQISNNTSSASWEVR